MIKYKVADVETTTHNKGHRFDPRNILVSQHIKAPETLCDFYYHTDPDFYTPNKLDDCDVVVGFNFKFDFHWLYHLEPCLQSKKIWDCQLAEFVYSGQKDSLISLDECLERYGLEKKKNMVAELWAAGVQTTDIDPALLEEYGNWDSSQTEQLFLIQWGLLSEAQKTLVFLLGEDLKTLVEMERHGLLFNQKQAEGKANEYQIRIREIERLLQEQLPPIQSGVFNWDSGDHLSCFLYGGVVNFDYAVSEPAVYKSGDKKGQPYVKNKWFVETVPFPRLFVPIDKTELAKTKNKLDVPFRLYSTDSPTLASLKVRTKQQKEILTLLNERSKLKKVVEMIYSLFDQFETKQWENNIIHGQYNQNIAATGRLTSSAPNMQNTPPELDEFFVSRFV